MIDAMGHPAPLVGYNTNVRHRGKVFHIQTEDLGLKRRLIVTQLFADGGRVIASQQTSYEHEPAGDELAAVIKKLMQNQHKQMFIGLRDGLYEEGEQTAEDSTEVLDHAAARLVEEAGHAARRYESIRPLEASIASEAPPAPFGQGVLSEKSLDEVILAYLAKDLQEQD